MDIFPLLDDGLLVLFLQAKFGLSGTKAGLIYSIFYFSIYILAFVGGLIAVVGQFWGGANPNYYLPLIGGVVAIVGSLGTD